MGKNIKIFVIIILTAFLSCNTTEPPPEDDRKLTLTFEDASCIEAWITLTTNNIQLPAEINLTKADEDGNLKSQILNLKSKDSLLYIDSLLPNKTYTIQAFNHSTNQSELFSNKIAATTMDTTSHNFTFETWTFGGDAGSCSLYDVAIIDENNIWAVGEIFISDTSEIGYTMFNAAHWDGSEWTLKRIFFPTVCGSSNFTSYPAKAIFAFDDGEIWISSSGDKIAILKDGVQTDKFCLPSNVSMSINKTWGTSSNDLYVVGNNGKIAHYQNGQWTRIESGTNLNILDIWGIPDGKGNYNIYCASIDALLKIDAGNIVQRINTEQGHSISSVWGNTDRLIYTAGGSGLSLYKNYKWEKINEPIANTARIIRGQNHKDICGLISLGSIIHFNGYSCQIINTSVENTHYRAEIKNNLIVAVGWLTESALITILKRN